mmetsp:Transcript_54834/g.95867  ORF Transcript_54834/g.95867 Transcript_54834/m.95867 type:complete len:237 (-) Transcript_54834:193-903(-)
MTISLSTGFCFPTSTPGEFQAFSCNSAAITTSTFRDAACTDVISTSTTSPPLNYCFATDVDDDGYINADTGAWDSNKFTCTTGYPQNTLSAASVSRKVFGGAGCSNSNMIKAQFGLQDSCYTNYNGTNYTSFVYDNPYRYNFDEANCNPGNLVETIYLPLDSCSDEDGTSVSYAIYGTTATGSNGSDSGVSTDKLAIGIVFSFIGGAIVTGLGVFMWLRRAKSVPLGSKADHASNL